MKVYFAQVGHALFQVWKGEVSHIFYISSILYLQRGSQYKKIRRNKMKVYDAAHIKNIAVVGHGGDGKTTLVEAFLADAGVIERRGRVEDGNTTTDYDSEEARRQISLTAAMAPLE